MKLIRQFSVVSFSILLIILLSIPESSLAATPSGVEIYMAKGKGASSVLSDNQVTPNSNNNGWSPAWKN